jgi:hypothetical protein
LYSSKPQAAYYIKHTPKTYGGKITEDDYDLLIQRRVDERGNVFYEDRDGRLHRIDGPASEWLDGTKFWFRHGKLHRDNGAAVEWGHGGKEWWIEGKRFRKDGPLTEWPDGRQWW